MPNSYEQIFLLLKQPGTLAVLVPLLVVSVVLLVGFGFAAGRLLVILFGGGFKARFRLLFSILSLLRQRQAKSIPPGVVGDPPALLRLQQLELENQELRQQLEAVFSRNADLRKEIEILQAALHSERTELELQNQKVLSVQRHAEKLEVQMEQVVGEFERIYRKAPGQENSGPGPAAAPRKDETAPELGAPSPSPSPFSSLSAPSPEPDSDMEKLRSLLRAYQDTVDRPDDAEQKKRSGS